MANKITVDHGVCKGCELCVHACPKKILEIDRTKLNARGYHPAACTDTAGCIACAICAVICPDSAIKVEKEV
ncbi:MAG: 4Fe-4S binding protein [Oscillospiraceae bacterium]|nr:4Fe-4S binding protein [Oscillospiraceae bacterium]